MCVCVCLLFSLVSARLFGEVLLLAGAMLQRAQQDGEGQAETKATEQAAEKENSSSSAAAAAEASKGSKKKARKNAAANPTGACGYNRPRAHQICR